ncbi:MAG TPA: Asp-tRNA(Asn)/Glu-tRNA(Gln) amidotransferase subunit GatB, partial [Myxococcota bacterium]
GWEVVVGLECHVQLLTQSKLFSAAPVRFGSAPNENVDVIDVALPGTLPVLNARAVEHAIALGLALGATVRKRSTFARKHYFYPDLPKGYQISQFDEPVVEGGALVVDGRPIPIVRAHLEEDAGKSSHAEDGTALDYNRAGTALLEVVTAPALRSASEATAFFRTLRTLVMALHICDGDLENGSMRADVNVSVRKRGDDKLGQRVELKNINSPRFVGLAIEHEMRRQIRELNGGNRIVLETRLWDADKNESRSMRGKEEAHDYRYFADPDLPVLVIDDAEIEAVRARLPELPQALAARLLSLGLAPADAALLAGERALAGYFDEAVQHGAKARTAANWIVNEVLAVVNARGLEVDAIATVLAPSSLAALVRLIDDGAITGKVGKDVLAAMVSGGGSDPVHIVNERGLRVVRNSGALAQALDQLVADNAGQWQSLRDGKDKLRGFFVGQVMKKTGGTADPVEVNRLIDERLSRP